MTLFWRGVCGARAMRRSCSAPLLAAALLLTPGPAAADEGIARRLGALKSLVSPTTSRPVAQSPLAPVGGPEDACPPGTWWRITEYGVRARTDAAIRDAAVRFAVDPQLVRSVIHHESAFDIHAVSPKGAMGLMQLMPATARRLGVVCPFDPRENVLGGTRYLRRLRDRFGSWPQALAAYHAGPTRVAEGRIPGETRRYVKRVVGSWRPDRLTWMALD
jgi:soluble lytic murein transglycosylase-like protein